MWSVRHIGDDQLLQDQNLSDESKLKIAIKILF